MDYYTIIYPIIQISAAVLSIINAAILVHNFISNRPILALNPVKKQYSEPNFFFRYPQSSINRENLYRYGFIVNFTVVNKGNKDTSLMSWDLLVKIGGSTHNIPPFNIPELNFKFPELDRVITFVPIGFRRVRENDLIIKSGGVITGFAFYLLHFTSKRDISIIFHGGQAGVGQIEAFLQITDAYGNKIKKQMIFSEITFQEGRNIANDIDFVQPAKIIHIN